MSNSIKINTEQYEIDSNSKVIAQTDDSFTTSYSEALKQTFALANMSAGSPYMDISMGTISTAAYAKLSSDQELSLKLNSGSDILSGVKNLNINGGITAVSIKNTSGETANIEIDIFGD